MNRSTTLRSGYTTGTCAAAAAKGALLGLLKGRPDDIEILLPCRQTACIPVHKARRKGQEAVCEVIKDAGDDPDVTHGALIWAAVQLIDSRSIEIRGGQGVGIVTRPGLAVAPGRPAINPVPNKMIRQALKPLLPAGCGARVTIGVADGEALAKKTLNGRLGIIGGISILGTTGIVMPYSHEAYRESITCALDVARAMKLDRVVLSTGRSSETIARKVFPEVPEPGFVLMGDHFAHAVHEAVQHGMRHLIIACFPAKLLKIAGGADNTHASASSMDLSLLGNMAAQKGAGKSVRAALAHINTVREAFDSMPDDLRQRVCCLLARQVGEQIHARSGNRVASDVLIIAYDNRVLYQRRS